MSNLVGKSYTFEDGSIIHIIQIKIREHEDEPKPVVTYTVQMGNSLPRKLVLPLQEFLNTFGHLFGEDDGL